MKLRDLALEIAMSYVQKKHPEEVETLREYAKVLFSDLKEYVPPESSDQFGPMGALGGVVAPVVLGLIVNWLYDLMKGALSKSKAPIDQDIQLRDLAEVLSRSEKRLRDIESKLFEQTKRPNLSREVLVYSVNYITSHDEDERTDMENKSSH